MNQYHKYEWIIISLSFLIAYILEQIPWPNQFIYYKPTWYILILIYWIITLPQNINIGVSFIFGILIDFIEYSFIGIHALLYSIICYLTLNVYTIFCIIKFYHQSIFIILLSIITDYIMHFINFLSFNSFNYELLYNAISNAIAWPLILMILNKIRMKFFNFKNINNIN